MFVTRLPGSVITLGKSHRSYAVVVCGSLTGSNGALSSNTPKGLVLFVGLYCAIGRPRASKKVEPLTMTPVSAVCPAPRNREASFCVCTTRPVPSTNAAVSMVSLGWKTSKWWATACAVGAAGVLRKYSIRHQRLRVGRHRAADRGLPGERVICVVDDVAVGVGTRGDPVRQRVEGGRRGEALRVDVTGLEPVAEEVIHGGRDRGRTR